jgi:hypothetical protein
MSQKIKGVAGGALLLTQGISVIPAKAGIRVFSRIAKSFRIPGIKAVTLNQQYFQGEEKDRGAGAGRRDEVLDHRGSGPKCGDGP